MMPRRGMDLLRAFSLAQQDLSEPGRGGGHAMGGLRCGRCGFMEH